MMVPSRGQVWKVRLGPVEGHEQDGTRPALVVSVDPFNHGPARLAIVVPITRTPRGIPFHIQITPPEGGLRATSYAMTEAVRSISTERLIERWGEVLPSTLADVEDKLRIVLGL